MAKTAIVMMYIVDCEQDKVAGFCSVLQRQHRDYNSVVQYHSETNGAEYGRVSYHLA